MGMVKRFSRTSNIFKIYLTFFLYTFNFLLALKFPAYVLSVFSQNGEFSLPEI